MTHYIESMPLKDAKLCTECSVIHNGKQCPYCASSEGQLMLAQVLNRNVGKEEKIMNLQIVTGPPFTATCISCEKRVIAGSKGLPFGTELPVYADLNGKPFTDYYCSSCAADLRAKANMVVTHG